MHIHRLTFRSCLSISLGLTLVGLTTHTAKADPITYTEQATASGSLGANNFTNGLITFTFVGDTANVIGSSGFYTNATGTATVSGVGTATFTDSMYIFDNQTYNGIGAAGIADNTLGLSLLDTIDSAFSTYDLTTSIGPVSNTPFYYTGQSYQTDAGGLVFSSLTGNATFTATVNATTATPEPAGMLPIALGMFGLGLVLAARKRIAVKA